jgi:choline dehydrogenase-like flavoprotein
MNIDTIIIGTGVAGTAIATKLLESNPTLNILMLEAGDKQTMRDFSLFQNFLVTNKLPNDSNTIYDAFCDLDYPKQETIGENQSNGNTQIPLQGARLFMYGGSTGHWGGWSFRLKPEDFKLKTNTGKGIDWPIDYDDLEPFYLEAEHFIGVSGNNNDPTFQNLQYPYNEFPFTIEDGPYIDAFKKLGINHSNLPIARYGLPKTAINNEQFHTPCQTTGTCKYCPFGSRYVAANNLDELIQKGSYPNFKIITNAVVKEVLMESKNQASGIIYYDKNSNKEIKVYSNKIILAAGAIESAKILLRSESEHWKEGIGNDKGLVGRNLVSHPYFFFKATLPKNEKMLQPQMGFPTLVSRHYDSVEEQWDGKFILINPVSSPKVNLAKSMSKGMKKDEIISSINQNVTVQIQGMLEVFSNRDNRVLNSDKRNRFGLNETIINFSKDENFDNRINYIQSVVAKIFEEMGAKNTTMEMSTSWRADHAACTTRMSDSPNNGVVDKNLRVHGVDNLYVCSNSSFSSLGAVNPTLTLTALALRLGSYLNKQ